MTRIRGSMLLVFAVGLVPSCTSDPPAAPDAARPDSGVVPCVRDSDCDDDRYCTGTERCAPDAGGHDARGCVASGNPCAASEICDDTMDRCRDDCPDADGDDAASSACGGTDCDDADPHRYPGNLELCDAVDQDCDPSTVGYRDADHDGLMADVCCNPDASGGAPTCGTDCDDASSLVGAGATEVCDTRDNDCNGMVDDATGMVDWYPDADGDGFGDPAGTPISSCMLVVGRVPNRGDCDDDRARRSPGAPEVCDGIDNDCDTRVDESALPLPWFIDFDGDGFGDPADTLPISSCAPVPGRSLDPRDCDDEDAARNPAQAEVCDGDDNDCDELLDENVPQLHFYADADLDAYGNGADGILACRGDATHTSLYAGDCDDTMATVNPRGIEVCNTVDDDCNRIVDGNCFADITTTPTTLLPPATGATVIACGANEVLVGVRYNTRRYCDLGCSADFVGALAGICARAVMSGSPSPPVTYAVNTYAEHVVGPTTLTLELRCPADQVVTGMAVGGIGGGMTLTCRRFGGTLPTTVTLVTPTSVDYAPHLAVTECPSATRALTSFDWKASVAVGDLAVHTLQCSSVVPSTMVP